MCGRGWTTIPIEDDGIPSVNMDFDAAQIAHRSWVRCWWCKQWLVKCRCEREEPAWRPTTRSMSDSCFMLHIDVRLCQTIQAIGPSGYNQMFDINKFFDK